MTYKTTLGAPLTDEEYNEITKALVNAKLYTVSIRIGQDPVVLMDAATNIIDRGFKLRDAIQQAFNAANKRNARALVGGARGHLKVVKKYTQSDIDELVDFIRKEKP